MTKRIVWWGLVTYFFIFWIAFIIAVIFFAG